VVAVSLAILAGDILVVACLKESGTKRQEYNVKPFFDALAKKYKKVFLVMGNHEFYRGDIMTAAGIYRNYLLQWPNFVLLDQKTVALEDTNVRILGTTLWTDFDNENPITMMIAGRWMSDFRVIKDGNIGFSPGVALNYHKDDKYFIEGHCQIAKRNNEKLIVVTHHTPSYQSVVDRFKGDDLNGAFHSELRGVFCEQILYWIHGHIHDPVNYMIEDTNVLANPRGYPGENLAYNPNLVIEV
jgi:Icc-related predicted phosphoesterase